VDEVRAVIHDSNNTTAYLTFSTQIGPKVDQFRIWGPKNSIFLDNTHRMIVKLEASGLKSFLRYFFGPSIMAKEYFRNTWQNIFKFIKSDFHETYGMKTLIEKFYNSVKKNTPPPIPYKEIIRTARIMDAIFEQIKR
jgi:hypothetical protein